MKIPELAFLYLLVGAGCAAYAWTKLQGTRRFASAALCIPFWPLLLPSLLAGATNDDDTSDDERHFLDVLARIDGTPLASLLPDRTTVLLLSKRLRTASDRVIEIDRLLERPEFSQADAEVRLGQLRLTGDAAAAAAVQSRVQNIARLRMLRKRFSSEIEAIHELLSQLRVQAELVRLSGAADAGSRELVGNVLARIDGLDTVLAEDAQPGVLA